MASPKQNYMYDPTTQYVDEQGVVHSKDEKYTTKRDDMLNKSIRDYTKSGADLGNYLTQQANTQFAGKTNQAKQAGNSITNPLKQVGRTVTGKTTDANLENDMTNGISPQFSADNNAGGTTAQPDKSTLLNWMKTEYTGKGTTDDFINMAHGLKMSVDDAWNIYSKNGGQRSRESFAESWNGVTDTGAQNGTGQDKKDEPKDTVPKTEETKAPTEYGSMPDDTTRASADAYYNDIERRNGKYVTPDEQNDTTPYGTVEKFIMMPKKISRDENGNILYNKTPAMIDVKDQKTLTQTAKGWVDKDGNIVADTNGQVYDPSTLVKDENGHLVATKDSRKKMVDDLSNPQVTRPWNWKQFAQALGLGTEATMKLAGKIAGGIGNANREFMNASYGTGLPMQDLSNTGLENSYLGKDIKERQNAELARMNTALQNKEQVKTHKELSDIDTDSMLIRGKNQDYIDTILHTSNKAEAMEDLGRNLTKYPKLKEYLVSGTWANQGMDGNDLAMVLGQLSGADQQELIESLKKPVMLASGALSSVADWIQKNPEEAKNIGIGAAAVSAIGKTIPGILGVISLFKAKGGFVEGNIKHGDHIPVMANSGEMFLNEREQTNAYNKVTGSRVKGNLSEEQKQDLFAMFDGKKYFASSNSRNRAIGKKASGAKK